MFGSCDFSAYQVQPVSAESASARAHAVASDESVVYRRAHSPKRPSRKKQR